MTPSRPTAAPDTFHQPWKLVRLASSGFALIVVLVTASHLVQLWRAMRLDAEADRATYARIFSSEVNRNLVVLRAQMDAIDGKVLQALASGESARAGEILAQVTRELTLVRELAVVAPDGRILASSQPSHVGVSVAGYDFLSAPRDGRLQIGRPKEGRSFAPGQVVREGDAFARSGFLTISRPASGLPDSPLLVAVMGTDSLLNELRRMAGVDETFTLMRYDGTVLASTSETPPAPRKDHPIFSRFLPDRETGAFWDTDLDGTRWLAHFVTAEEFPVLVETRIPVSAVLQRWRAEIIYPLLLLVLVLVAVWAFRVMLFRSLRRLDEAGERSTAQERRLRNILDSAADGIVTIDQRGIVREYNRAAEGVFRKSAAEAVGRPLAELLAPELADHQAFLDRYLRTGVAAIIGKPRTIQSHRRDGSPLVVQLAVSAVIEDGEHYFTGIVRDVTDIREAEERFRTLFQRSGEPHLLFGASGLVDANDAALALLGASQLEDVRGRSIEDLAAPVQGPEATSSSEFLRGFEKVAREEGVARLEWTAKTLQGTPVPVEMTLTLIRISEGDALLVAFHDITERQRYEHDLRSARDAAETATLAKSRFLAMMSHELRTPMAGMIGMVELLGDSALSAEQKRFVTALDSSAKSLLHVLNDVLDFSKIEADRLVLEEVDFDPLATVRDTIELFANAASRKGNEIRISCSDRELPSVKGDPTRLRQLLFNLVGNAVKFTERGTVTVGVSSRPSPLPGEVFLRVEVRDTGIGIPADVLPTLFRPFQQADNTTTRRFGGTGLGLAICRRLAEAMGGMIGVESESGRGSNFWFELRLKRATSAPADHAAATPGSAPASLASRPLRILVAEDNAVNRLLISTRLRRAGHDVVLVEDGVKAVKAVREGDFDLVLMDMQMPELDGAGATRQIRGFEGSRGRIPIVALTADALPEFREQYMQAGLDDYLTKPVDWNALDRVLARFGSGRTVA